MAVAVHDDGGGDDDGAAAAAVVVVAQLDQQGFGVEEELEQMQPRLSLQSLASSSSP